MNMLPTATSASREKTNRHLPILSVLIFRASMLACTLATPKYLVAQSTGAQLDRTWEHLANFEWTNAQHSRFKACSRDSRILASVSFRGIEYRDGYSGILLAFHPQLGAQAATLSHDEKSILLCRVRSKSAIITSVFFGSGLEDNQITIPLTIEFEDAATPQLIQATKDGKYLLVLIRNDRTATGEFVVWNRETNEKELEITEKFHDRTRESSIYEQRYDPHSETVLVEHMDAASIVHIPTGSRVLIDKPGDLLFINGELFELNRNKVSQIDLRTGKRKKNMWDLSKKNVYLTQWGKGLVVHSTDDRERFFVVRDAHAPGVFVRLVETIVEHGFTESLSGAEALQGENPSNDFGAFFEPIAGVFHGSNGKLWRAHPAEQAAQRGTKSEQDCKSLIELWQRGYEGKTKDWFQNLGLVRRSIWQADYEMGCPYAACLLGVAVSTGADGVKSVEKGKRFLKHAVDRGFSDAAFWLALFEVNGEISYQVLLAARQDRSPLVLEALAECYRQGIGCEIDMMKALELSIEASDMAGGGASAVSVAKMYEKGAPSKRQVRLINAGAEDVGMWRVGTEWKDSRTYRTGESVDRSGAQSPAPEGVYQSLVVGGKEVGGRIFCKIPAKSGGYVLRLHFMEPFIGTQGSRKMDVQLQGKLAAKDLDVFTLAGGMLKAYVLDAPVKVVDDKGVEISLVSKNSNEAILSGIELLTDESTVELSPVEPDPRKAFFFYQKAVDARALDSEYHLAMCYLNGTGVEASPREAFKWFREGVATGSVLAKYGMALCLENGAGCETNLLGANRLYQECESLGLKQARNDLVRIKKDVAALEREVDSSNGFSPSGRVVPGGVQRGSSINEEARAAVREYRSHVSGQLGVNGLIFRPR
jgi:TPR repeat protein